MNPGEAQARVRLAALLFRTAMPRLAKALADAGQAPLRPDEKARLFARLEEGAWGFGPEVFEGAEDESWEERALASHPARALLEGAVGDVVRARRG